MKKVIFFAFLVISFLCIAGKIKQGLFVDGFVHLINTLLLSLMFYEYSRK